MRSCLIFLVTVYGVNSKFLPDFIPQCYDISEGVHEKCVADAIETLKPHLEIGIRKLRVPPYDPLFIPGITVDRTTDFLRIKTRAENIYMTGLRDYQLRNLSIDVDKLAVNFTAFFPKIGLTTDFNITGNILTQPLGSGGILNVNLTDCDVRCRFIAKKYIKRGKEFVRILKFLSDVRIGNGRLKITDHGPNAYLSLAAQNFLNANPRLSLDIFKPIIDESNDAIFLAFVNQIAKKLPFDELVPGL